MDSKDMPKDEIERFLRTGECDISFRALPGRNVLECAQLGNRTLREALVAEVLRLSVGKNPVASLPKIDVKAFAKTKVEPMVRGLFPRYEQDQIINVLSDAVVFLTPDNIENVLCDVPFPKMAWDLANLYLGSVRAKLLEEGIEAGSGILGMSVEMRCYVSLEYFANQDRFADFVVHEAAHVFHNCKRKTIGLPERRSREWLLDIGFRDREVFAYACEAYSRILEHGKTKTERMSLFQELEKRQALDDDRMDATKYLAAVGKAVTAMQAQGGWKHILAACAPQKGQTLGPPSV